MNPLLSRELATRWRDGRAFGLVFVLTALLSLLFAWLYHENAPDAAQNASSARWSLLGHSLFSAFAWLQTLLWLLISPTLTSSSIAYERERGWFDALILSPLLPRQIIVGKWIGALAYAATLYLVTLPFLALTLLMGGVSPLEFRLVVGLHFLCATCGSALGMAASAWSFRSSRALGTARGLILLWLIVSFGGALVAGETPWGLGAVFARVFSLTSPPPLLTWLGRTNPILRALEITSASPTQHWPLCFAFLGAATLFFLTVAAYCARRPLAEAPFIQKKKSSAKTPSTHAKIPLVTRLKFANPVLDREVRSKFIMRQPPLVVIVAEAILALVVAYFYVRTLLWALFEPQYRPIIWWGLVFTGLIVTMMAAATMGSNGFSRERERGTWESVRLSLLRPHEILRGKVGSSLLACALFSLAVWPLLLPCVTWNAGWNRTSGDVIAPLQVMACALIWGATAWSYTLIGLWVGRKQARSARAAGQTVGLLAAFLLLCPALLIGLSLDRQAEWILSLTHPLVATAMAVNGEGLTDVWATGIPFAAFHLVLGAGLWWFLRRAVGKELDAGSAGE